MINKSHKNMKLPSSSSKIIALIVIALMLIFVLTRSQSEKFNNINRNNSNEHLYLSAATWNIAAINNNPFEYWITMNGNAIYNRMMKNVSLFITNPGVNDVMISDIFTPQMYDMLEYEMKQKDMKGLDELKKAYWTLTIKNRKIITEFITDGTFGKKRLISMPDRITNTINSIYGPLYRPTAINCYDEKFLNYEDWWIKWIEFIFHTSITAKKKGVLVTSNVSDMLSTIKHSKYPAITLEEEIISIPLQILSLAIFDSILIHMLFKISRNDWQIIRKDICNQLNHRKLDRTIEILQQSYHHADIIFIQEATQTFNDVRNQKQSQSKEIDSFDVYPSGRTIDHDRDQNSLILLKNKKFIHVKDVTAEVVEEFPKDVKIPLENGDLVVLYTINSVTKDKFILASFHGDTNGLATIPIVRMIHRYAVQKHPDCQLLFGLDANTYANPESDQLGVKVFGEFYRTLQLNSCYGLYPNPFNFTTFHARTHLQPQLNKAVSLEERDKKGDKNPKDFILFFDSDYTVVETKKDNTGEGRYLENTIFPSLEFPSDHGITSTVLLKNEKKELRNGRS